MGDQTLRAWGDNSYGELGVGTNTGPELCGTLACSTSPVPVPGLSQVIGIAGEHGASLALDATGAVWAWGSNVFGQLGNGTSGDGSPNVTSPGRVIDLGAASAIAGGAHDSLAIALPAPATTVLTSSPNPSTYGQAVTFTATVSPTDGGGTVAFSAYGSTIAGCGSQALSLVGGSYQAACTTSSLPAGTHAIDATYGGDAYYTASAGSLDGGQVVQRAATAVKASPALLQLRPTGVDDFTLTAVLTVQGTGAPLSGQGLNFFSGTTPLCGGVVTSSSGSATCRNLTVVQRAAVVENRGYTVSFPGTSNYASSTARAGLIS